MTITRTYGWDMGHRLQRHRGLCRNLHGHRYTAEVTVKGLIQIRGRRAGMVMDFHDLDVAIRGILEPWDHAMMLEASDPALALLRGFRIGGRLRVVEFGLPPTAENIAVEIRDRLASSWVGMPPGVDVCTVRVYETPRSWAETTV